MLRWDNDIQIKTMSESTDTESERFFNILCLINTSDFVPSGVTSLCDGADDYSSLNNYFINCLNRRISKEDLTESGTPIETVRHTGTIDTTEKNSV